MEDGKFTGNPNAPHAIKDTHKKQLNNGQLNFINPQSKTEMTSNRYRLHPLGSIQTTPRR
jgi:hypothetical protein